MLINTNKPDPSSTFFEDDWMKDELKKKEAHNEFHSKKLQRLIDLNASDVIIEEQKRILNLSVLDYEYELKQHQIAEENFRIEYLKQYPETPEEIAEIYKQFDLWFDENKDNRIAMNSAEFDHCFVEPWYDDWTPFKKMKYHTLNLGKIGIRYTEVFGILDKIVESRYEELCRKYYEENGYD